MHQGRKVPRQIIIAKWKEKTFVSKLWLSKNDDIDALKRKKKWLKRSKAAETQKPTLKVKAPKSQTKKYDETRVTA